MKVLLGVTGGIAAYKAVEIASQLVQKGHGVLTLMTKHACEFVTPLTFESITGQVVIRDLFQPPPQHRPIHITTADWGDVMLVAPATANFIGKVAGGIADDVLTSTVMALRCPVLIAPAMNDRMYENAIVAGNIKKLEGHGYEFIPPEEGYLADGYRGVGRLADVNRIVAAVLAKAPREGQPKPSGPLLARGIEGSDKSES